MTGDFDHVIGFVALGFLTYLMRASFIVIWGNRDLPQWAVRHLRYTSVTVIPAMIAPLFIYPKSNAGEVDWVWILSAIIAICFGLKWKNPLVIMLAGASFFILAMALRSFGILF